MDPQTRIVVPLENLRFPTTQRSDQFVHQRIAEQLLPIRPRRIKQQLRLIADPRMRGIQEPLPSLFGNHHSTTPIFSSLPAAYKLP